MWLVLPNTIPAHRDRYIWVYCHGLPPSVLLPGPAVMSLLPPQNLSAHGGGGEKHVGLLPQVLGCLTPWVLWPGPAIMSPGFPPVPAHGRRWQATRRAPAVVSNVVGCLPVPGAIHLGSGKMLGPLPPTLQLMARGARDHALEEPLWGLAPCLAGLKGMGWGGVGRRGSPQLLEQDNSLSLCSYRWGQWGVFLLMPWRDPIQPSWMH